MGVRGVRFYEAMKYVLPPTVQQLKTTLYLAHDAHLVLSDFHFFVPLKRYLGQTRGSHIDGDVIKRMDQYIRINCVTHTHYKEDIFKTGDMTGK